MLWGYSQELQRQHFGVCVEKPHPSTAGSSFSPEAFQASSTTLLCVTQQAAQLKGILGFLIVKYLGVFVINKTHCPSITDKESRESYSRMCQQICYGWGIRELSEPVCYCPGIWWKCYAQNWPLSFRNMDIKWGAEDSNGIKNKNAGWAGFACSEKEGCGGKTRRGTVISQRPVGDHTGNTELVCPQGHRNSHWVKPQQEGWRYFVVRHLKRLRREALSMVVFKNSIDTHN